MNNSQRNHVFEEFTYFSTLQFYQPGSLERTAKRKPFILLLPTARSNGWSEAFAKSAEKPSRAEGDVLQFIQKNQQQLMQDSCILSHIDELENSSGFIAENEQLMTPNKHTKPDVANQESLAREENMTTAAGCLLGWR